MTNGIALSFEVFPVRDEIAQKRLASCIHTLDRLSPRFVSVTFGADGAARDLTRDTLGRIRAAHAQRDVAGHITATGGSRADVIAMARAYEATGARWAVALRGDGAGAGEAFVPHEGGFADAPELIAALRAQTGLRIAVGGYPEPHPDSQGAQADLDHLKRKVDAGADAIITQFFFENDDFFRYVDDVRGAGIDVPIIPGIMPIKDFGRLQRFAARCGASIPARFAERFERAEARGAARELALAICAGQCDELREQGVRAFHFYTLNDAALSLATCQALGLDPTAPVDGGTKTDVVEAALA